MQAEWLRRRGDNNLVDLDDGVTANADAWYIQLSQRLFEGAGKYMNYLEPVVQVDYVDINDMKQNSVFTVAPGLVYSPEPFLQVKLEYDIVFDHTAGKKGDNVFWASIVLEF